MNEVIEITTIYTKRDALLKITEIVNGDSTKLANATITYKALFEFLGLSEIAKRKEGDARN